MKILIFISQVYQLGGAEKLDFDLALELKKRGYDVEVAIMYTRDIHNGCKNVDILNKYDLKVHYLGLEVNPNKIKFLLSSWKLRNILKNGKFDVIATSTVSPAIITTIATAFMSVKVIVGVHQVYDIYREKSVNYKIYRLLVNIRKNINFYFISNFVRDGSQVFFGEEKCKKGLVLYNSIRNDFFDITDINPKYKEIISNELGFKDKKIILFCGRVSKYKGIELVLDASLPLLKNDCVLIYLGGVDYNVKGTKEALESINKKIAENNVYDSVFFLGYRDDVREIMSISNVLVHPTEIEGFGLVLAEACALGLPIISSNSEAIPEVLSSTSATIIDNFNKDEYEKRIRDKLQECDDKKSHYRDKEIIFNKYSLESRVDNFCEKYL